MKILIAEDDLNIREGLKDLLTREGYEVIAAENGQVALDYYQNQSPQLVILDIMMPVLDGYSVCREIRKHSDEIPIIFLSAKSEEIDRVIGLEMGADDYINKPFGIREVVARIRAVTRRYLKTQQPQSTDAHFSFGDLIIYPNELRGKNKDKIVDLSIREIKILRLLSQRVGQVVTRDTLFNECWGHDHFPNSRTLDQHISKLRKQVEDNPSQPRWIKTVHGAGYRYENTT